MRSIKLVAGILAALALGACGGGGSDVGEERTSASGASDSTTTTHGSHDAYAVVMKLIAFKPERTGVPAGSAVTWRQTDPGVHTVTSGTVVQESGGVREVPDGRFDSGQIATGKTFEFTFTTPGAYPYFCSVHPATMRGEVTVT